MLAGDVLVVPYGHLTALDPATGAVRWRHDAPWRHYGTPAVAHVGGAAWVLTPDGAVVRASDGAVVTRDLADAWYVGPTVTGDVAVWVEARADAKVRAQGGVDVRAVRLAPAPNGVVATPLWTARVDVRETFYAPPSVVDGRLLLVSRAGDLRVLELADGKPRATLRLDALAPHAVFASPAVAGGRLYVTSEAGRTAVIALGEVPTVLAVSELEPMRTSPAFSERRIYLRTKDRLVAAGR